MKKKKRTTPKPYTARFSSVRYSKYLTALLEAQQNTIDNQAFWGVGPGERPQRVQADFRHVAKKEKTWTLQGKDPGMLREKAPIELWKETLLRIGTRSLEY